MRRFRILVISFLLSACAPQVMSLTPIPSTDDVHVNTEFPQSSPTFIPTETRTPIPSTSTELDFELPPDCSIFDPLIDPIYYHDLSHGACNHPALSPDGSQIAYAVLSMTESGEILQEARLFSRSLSESSSIYTSKCGNLYPEWSSTGYLVISDYAQDVGCESTVIYDMTNSKIKATLAGAVHRSWAHYWSVDKNSFFTLSPDLFGPECSETLSGYDFISDQPISTIKPTTPNTNIYVVISNPVWSADNKSLWAVLRDGVCSNPEANECTYRNSYIISVNFSETAPTISYPYYDTAIDYSFAKSNTVNLEIRSTASQTVSCLDVEVEESK